MTNKEFKLPGNPYALIVNNVIEHVVAMQEYDQKEIERVLALYKYDYFLDVAKDIGYEVTCGQMLVDGVWIDEQVHADWVLDTETRRWVPPVEYPDDGRRYMWNEEIHDWEPCSNCLDIDGVRELRKMLKLEKENLQNAN